MIVVNGKQCNVDVMDALSGPAGEEGGGPSAGIVTGHIRNGEGFACVFSLSDRATLEAAGNIRERVMGVKGDACPIVLIGNRQDVAEERAVTEQEARSLAGSWGIPYVETSAKTGHNVNVAFYDLAEAIAKRKNEERLKLDNSKNTKHECSIS